MLPAVSCRLLLAEMSPALSMVPPVVNWVLAACIVAPARLLMLLAVTLRLRAALSAEALTRLPPTLRRKSPLLVMSAPALWV